MEDLEPFYPDRMAGRILGMGDVLSFVEKAQEVVSATSFPLLNCSFYTSGSQHYALFSFVDRCAKKMLKNCRRRS